MKSFLNILTAIIITIAASGCKKFLDVRTDSNVAVVPRTTADYGEILNNSQLATPDYLVADIATDDIMIANSTVTSNPASYYIGAYSWAPVVWQPTDADPMYNNSYRMILQTNLIIDHIDHASGGTSAQRHIIKAQAEINRAYYYFQLVNLYGTVYQSATAATDLAVPLSLHVDASAYPPRATVQQIYNQILQDLQDAENTAELPDFGVDVIHPGMAAAHALLARVYLFMGNYTSALNEANAALAIRSTLLDYNSFSFASGSDPSKGVNGKPVALTDQAQNPEMLLTRINTITDFYTRFSSPYIGPTLQALFDQSNDLRFIYNFSSVYSNPAKKYIPAYFLYNNSQLVFNYSIGVSEILLVKAECLARQGDAATALSALNTLRKMRYRTGAAGVILSTSNADIVLKYTLEERRRELFLHGGLRLFDLKRLNLDNRFKVDIQRTSEVNGSVTATLPAGSPRYLFPFAPTTIANNANIIQNPR